LLSEEEVVEELEKAKKYVEDVEAILNKVKNRSYNNSM